MSDATRPTSALLIRAAAVPLLWSVLCATPAAQESETHEAFAARIEKTLAAHPFFRAVTYRRVPGHEPFVFFLQRPARDDAEYERRVINHHLPFLRKLHDLFETLYVQPAGLRRRADAPGFAIAILHSAGDYNNYAQAVGKQGLHISRAHYNPELQLAVTYEDTFAQRDTNSEARHAILHEFCHALQHAFGTGERLPAAPWFNEGLADYRACCTNVASSLERPPMHEPHLGVLRRVYVQKSLVAWASTIEEMIAFGNYGDVVEKVRERIVRADEARALSVFYAQAQMLVRYLHEAGGGRHRAEFVQFLKHVLTGTEPRAAFLAAFGTGGQVDFAAMQRDFEAWAAACIQGRPPPDPLAMAAAGAPAELGAPAGFDAEGLQWRPEEISERIDLARRLCARGDFEQGLQALPAEAGEHTGLVERERERMTAAVELRKKLVDQLIAKRRSITVTVDGKEFEGRLGRGDGGQLELRVGREVRPIPLQAIGLGVLIREGDRYDHFDGLDRWLLAWLRWLDGEPLGEVHGLLDSGYSKIASLREDVTEVFGPKRGGDAAALAWLQALELPGDPAAARALLERLERDVVPFAQGPALAPRRELLIGLTRALAERTFSPDDPRCLGIEGPLETLGDGRVRLDYTSPQPGTATGFALGSGQLAGMLGNLLSGVAYEGPTELRTAGEVWHLIGAGLLEYVLPMQGRQEFEIHYTAPEHSFLALLMCGHDDKGFVLVHFDGTVHVADTERGIADTLGDTQVIYAGQKQKLRIAHDGDKKLVVRINDRVVTTVPSTGARNDGRLGLVVRSSKPIVVHQIRIEGKPMAVDPENAREAFVDRVVQRLWR